MTAAGWLDVNNRRGRIKAGDLDIEVGGVHDSHTKRDRYEEIAGQADPAADLRLGVMHSPEPRVLDRFTADGYDLLLAGHTHGGQLRIPLYGALVTNCGIDRERVSGLHRHPAAAPGPGSLTPGPGCTCRPGSAPHRGPRSGSPAGRRPRCSRWCRGSARLPEVPGKSAAPGVQAPELAGGVWRSLAARFVRDEEAAGSNPATPTSSTATCDLGRWPFSCRTAAKYSNGYESSCLPRRLSAWSVLASDTSV